MSSIVAIVGRPNVGKSTFFNRLIQRREAIVDSVSGVTRDRHYGKTDWNGRNFSVIDTGGYIVGSEDIFEEEIDKQVKLAIDEADAIIGDATDPEQRLTRAAAQLFSFYERGGRHLESDLREQELPAVQEWEGYLRDTVRAFVAAALAPLDPEEPAIASIAFLFDLRTFTAMRLRGMDVSSAVEVAVRMAIGYAGARPRQT